MAATPEYTEGQEVVVYTNGRSEVGHIDKVGRTLVHIRTGKHRVETYRMDNQVLNGHYSSGCYFRTLEEDADVKRRAALVKDLRQMGVRLESQSYTPEQLEQVRDLISTFRT